LASERSIVEKNSRWIATIPFGVGQFQNGSNTLGYTFLISETLLAGTTLASILVIGYQYQLLEDPTNSGEDISRNARLAYRVQFATSWALLAVAAGGVVEAQLNFVGQTERTEPRPLPPELRKRGGNAGVTVRPWVRALAGGAGVGVTGSF
jgi:hypothetical protein